MKLKLTALSLITLAALGLSGALLRGAMASAPVSPFVGTWSTQWKVREQPAPDARANVRFAVDLGNPNSLDGAVEVKGPNGVMYGTLSSDGKTLEGHWWNPGSVYGNFTFKLDTTGKSFTGTYTVAGSDTTYKWTGSKLE